jgi:hypothetical protein
MKASPPNFRVNLHSQDHRELSRCAVTPSLTPNHDQAPDNLAVRHLIRRQHTFLHDHHPLYIRPTHRLSFIRSCSLYRVNMPVLNLETLAQDFRRTPPVVRFVCLATLALTFYAAFNPLYRVPQLVYKYDLVFKRYEVGQFGESAGFRLVKCHLRVYS